MYLMEIHGTGFLANNSEKFINNYLFVFFFPAISGLSEYSVTSAFNDSRFAPISKHEMSSLTVSVSILLVSPIRQPPPHRIVVVLIQCFIPCSILKTVATIWTGQSASTAFASISQARAVSSCRRRICRRLRPNKVHEPTLLHLPVEDLFITLGAAM